MRYFVSAAIIVSSLFVIAYAAPPQPAVNVATKNNVGEKFADLRIVDDKGVARKLADAKDVKATVLVFVSFDCPISNRYVQPLNSLAKNFAKKNVRFVGLSTNLDESVAERAKHLEEFGLTFPVLVDEKLKIADALKAEITPEVFVLDSNQTLVYRGRIDDSYLQRLKENPLAKTHDLQQAIDEVLAGKAVTTPLTEAIGCSIVRPDVPVIAAGAATFHKDVLPILQNNCQTCHRPGEVGPFSLMTYKQAVNWADDIKGFTQKRIMPPWKPSDGPAFHNERRMSQRDIDILASWADGGMPEGDPKDAPAPKEFPQGWQLGTPDLVLTVEADFNVGPAGKDLFRVFVLPTNLGHDEFLTAVEYRPSNARVVHHILAYYDTTGQGRALLKKAMPAPAVVTDRGPEEWDRGPGYTSAMGVGFTPQGGLGGWAPGMMPRHLPEGSAYYLPKSADVILQVHFHRNGRPEKEKTQVGLYFAKNKVTKLHQSGVISGSGRGLATILFTIPAGADNYAVKGDSWATQDFTLYSVMPHMHMIGRKIDVTMTTPDGAKTTLVRVDDWDYNWQEVYTLKEPIQVKAGTRFHVDAVYDNSAKNLRNPFSPPRRINFGEETTNEMCFVFLGGTSQRLGRGLPLSATPPPAPRTASN